MYFTGALLCTYPGRSEYGFSVGATDQNDYRAYYSNYGVSLDLVAPGDQIHSTENTGYGTASGTSFSAPQVSGVAALLLCQNHCLTNIQLEDILKHTADKVNLGVYNYNWTPTKPGHSFDMGYGRLDAEEALKAADALYLPSSNDLYMKDTPRDWSVEPNPDNGPMWISEDIWVRNADDGLLYQWNQNPEYDAINPNYVYVRIRNHGCTDFTATLTDKLHVYWSKASTGLSWPTHWTNFTSQCPSNPPTLFGNEIGSGYAIPNIQAGKEEIIKIEWFPPNPASYSTCADQTHFCLLARIPNGLTYVESSATWLNVKNNNNIVWKNVSVVDNLSPGHTVSQQTIVRNVYDDTVLVKLFFKIPEEEYENSFLDYGTIKVNLGADLFKKWEGGGSVGDGFEICDDTLLKITDSIAWIGNILFDTSEMHVINSVYDQLVQQFDNCYFNFDIIQFDSLLEDTTFLTGGVRFQINTCNQEEEERISMYVINESKTEHSGHPYRLYPNPNTGEMKLDYHLNEGEHGEFAIFDLAGQMQCTYQLIEGKNTLPISRSFPNGIYFYQIFANGKRIGGNKLIIIN